MEAHIDLTNGNDTGPIYKTLDTAYKIYRINYASDIHLVFNIMNGYQYLGLDKCENCEFKNTTSEGGKSNYLKINSKIKLINVTFSIDVRIELNGKSGETLISCEKSNSFNNLDVSEIKKSSWFGNKAKSYQDLTLITNDEDLIIKGLINVKVDRTFTLVNNNSTLKSTFPNLESQGGVLFYSSDNAKLTQIDDSLCVDNRQRKIINVKNGISTGRFYNGEVKNNFEIANCYNNLIVKNVSVDVNYDSGKSLTIFHIRGKVNENQSKCPGINEGDLMLVKDSDIVSVAQRKLLFSNVTDTTKINTRLGNIEYEAIRSQIKTIKYDYDITDDDSSIFHIDDSMGDVTITISDDIPLEGKELYFRKMLGLTKNKVLIKVNKCNKIANGTILLTRSHMDITIYKHEDTFYVK